MEKPCCIGVVRDPSNLKGKEEKLGNLPYYIATPNEKNKRNEGVVVVHDIFGFSIPNTKYIVDYLASQGFDAVLGNLFASAGSWPDNQVPHGADFGAWFGKITSPEFFSTMEPEIKSLVDLLKKRGNTKVGIIGFCWGGYVAVDRIASTGLVSVAVSLHGGLHSASSIANAKCPVLIITVPNDATFSSENQEAVRNEFQKPGAVAGGIKFFDGVEHGFVVRGDFQGNPTLKEKADEALADTVQFLSTHLK